MIPEVAPITGEANALLFKRVRARTDRIPIAQRHLLAVSITPERGVEILPRGALASRLREAGLDAEARIAMTLAKGDRTAMVAWCEAGEDVNDAQAGFTVLRFSRR